MMMDPALAENQQLVNEILSGPDYFTCERTHTRMKKEICIKRQSKIRIPGGSWKYGEIPAECRDCPQGKKIKELGRPAVRDEASGELKEMDAEKKTCTRPGCDEPVKAKGLCTGHYNEEYNRQLREKEKGLREKIEIEPSKAAEEEAPATKEGHAIIMVDFADFPGLLEQLEKRARADFRPIEHQVLYLVKRGLEEST